MSLRDVAARLGDVLDATRVARASWNTAIDQVGDARTMFDDATVGSSSYEVQQVSDRYRTASDGLDDLAAALDAADSAVESIREHLVADSHAPGDAPALLDRGRPDSRPRPREPAEVAPGRVEQLRCQLPPAVVPNTGQKTHGRWIDPDGQVHAAVSGNDGNAAATARLLMDLLNTRAPPLVYSHVEMKLATHMRHSGIRSATLVINNVPCSERWGCDALLPTVLPDGYTLTVYGSNGFRREFRGNQT